MEPIFKDPGFSNMIGSWNFFASFHQYLEISDIFETLSMYDYRGQVNERKFMSKFNVKLISSLIKACELPNYQNAFSETLLGLIHSNSTQVQKKSFTEFSSYEIAHSLVNYTLFMENKEQFLLPQKPFFQLDSKQKFLLLKILMNNISKSTNFKNYVSQTCQKKKEETSQKIENQTPVQAQASLHQKEKEIKSKTLKIKQKWYFANYQTLLGFDYNGLAYFFFANIPDRIFFYSIQRSVWLSMVGKQNICLLLKKFLDQPNEKIDSNSLQLFEKIHLTLQYVKPSSECWAFKQSKKSELKVQKAEDSKKLQKLKQKLLNIQQSYSIFAGDCFNSRWNDKKARIKFREEVSKCLDLTQFKQVFIQFFDQTRGKNYQMINKRNPYCYSIDTQDLPSEQFRVKRFLCNYIYGDIKTVKIIRQFFDYQNGPFSKYPEAFLQIVQTKILSNIQRLYPKCHHARLIFVQKLKKKEEKQEKENQAKRKVVIRSKILFSSSQSQNESSKSTLDKKDLQKENSVKMKNGRLIRNMARVNYKLTNSNSTASAKRISNRLKVKQQFKKTKALKTRANLRSKKMILDSDESQEQDNDDDSSSDSNQINLSLQSFEYKKLSNSSRQQGVRRSLRTKN